MSTKHPQQRTKKPKIYSDDMKKLSIPIDPDLHDKLTEMARAEERSMSGQVVYLLKKAVGLK